MNSKIANKVWKCEYCDVENPIQLDEAEVGQTIISICFAQQLI